MTCELLLYFLQVLDTMHVYMTRIDHSCQPSTSRCKQVSPRQTQRSEEDFAMAISCFQVVWLPAVLS